MIDIKFSEISIKNAITAISEGFIWRDTAEGFNYWMEVNDRLQKILDTTKEENNKLKVCDKCGQELKQ